MTAQIAPQTVALTPDGPEVPALGIGTWSWGDSLFWNYGKSYGAAEVEAAFQAAVEAGINFFDTAEVYGLGESERLLGQFMEQTAQPVTIATKYFPLPWRFSRQAVADALTASLERLQQPQVALYQVHWPLDFLLGQSGLMQALADEVERGRIQAVGVSNYSAQQLRQAHGYLAQRGIPLAVNQVNYSLLNRKIETSGTLAAARELGVKILAYSPLAQGLLTGKYTAEGPQPAGARRISPRFSTESRQRLQPIVDALHQVGAQHLDGQGTPRTPAQVALNWLLSQGDIVPIPGAKNAEQARQNAGALGWEMSAAERTMLAAASDGWG